jgi:hypothetical protein
MAEGKEVAVEMKNRLAVLLRQPVSGVQFRVLRLAALGAVLGPALLALLNAQAVQ